MADIVGLSPLEAIIKSIQDKMGLLSQAEKEKLAEKVKEQAAKDRKEQEGGEEFDPETSWKEVFNPANYAEEEISKLWLILGVGVLVLFALKD